VSDPVRIVGISSSPRHGNTEYLVKTALDAACEINGDIVTEFESFVHKRIEPCTDCRVCVKTLRYCPKEDDWLELVKPLITPEPNGIIIGSPVYFFDVNSMLRAFFERCTCLVKQKWYSDFPYSPPDWSATVGGAIAVGFDRNGGVEAALTSILRWYLINGMLCVGGLYIGAAGWQGLQDRLDAVSNDDIGLAAAKELGRRVAVAACRLKAGVSALASRKTDAK